MQTLTKAAIVAVLAFVLSLASVGFAQQQQPRILVDNGETLIALDSACGWSTFNDALKPEFRGKAKGAVYFGRDRRTIAGCYVELNGHLLFVFVDGDSLSIPEGAFIRRPLPTSRNEVTI
jgi:hypothetical protein